MRAAFPGSNEQQWGAMAREYAEQRPTSPHALTEARVIFELLGDIKGKRIADVGCAAGFFSFQLVEKGANVIGIDASADMVACAREKQSTKGIPAGVLSFVCADVLKMSEKGTSPEGFDVALAADLLNNIEDLDRALEELNKILKHGGTLLIAIPHPQKVDGPEYFVQHWIRRGYKFVEITHPVDLYHRPIIDYMLGLSKAGFKITESREPLQDRNLKIRNEFDAENAEIRKTQPSMLVIMAEKP